jgi:hypothetical protein
VSIALFVAGADAVYIGFKADAGIAEIGGFGFEGGIKCFEFTGYIADHEVFYTKLDFAVQGVDFVGSHGLLFFVYCFLFVVVCLPLSAYSLPLSAFSL